MAYSLAYSSPYPQITLPTCLQLVYTKFLDNTLTTTESFLYHLLHKLRQDFFSVRSFIRESLKSDRGPPPLNEIPFLARLNFLLAHSCNWCGKVFGRIYHHPKTGKTYRPVKAKHHLHFLKVTLLQKRKLTSTQSNWFYFW